MAGSKPRLTLALLAASALVITGCGGDGSSTSTRGTASAQAPTDEAQRGGEASIEDFGSEAEGSERAQILALFGAYLNALAEKDYATVCADLSAAVQSSLARFAGKGSKGGCEAILPKLLAPTAARVATEQAEGKIAKVRVEDDRAFVVFKAPGAKLYQLTMVEEGGEWKAASVAAAVLVPEL